MVIAALWSSAKDNIPVCPFWNTLPPALIQSKVEGGNMAGGGTRGSFCNNTEVLAGRGLQVFGQFFGLRNEYR